MQAVLHFNRGVELAENGELESAMRSYEHAAGDAGLAPKAQFNLAVLKSALGDIDGAKQTYEEVIGAGDPDASAKAAFNLGRLVQLAGDIAAALRAFTLASETGHAEVAPLALRQLAQLHAPALEAPPAAG